MSYYSSFYLREYKNNEIVPLDKKILSFIIENIDEDLDNEGYVYSTWYCANEDLLEISRSFPNKIFVLERIGERTKDIERTYFKNGQYETHQAIISWPHAPDLPGTKNYKYKNIFEKINKDQISVFPRSDDLVYVTKGEEILEYSACFDEEPIFYYSPDLEAFWTTEDMESLSSSVNLIQDKFGMIIDIPESYCVTGRFDKEKGFVLETEGLHDTFIIKEENEIYGQGLILLRNEINIWE